MGIHRLYLKSAFAAVFIVLFVGVLFCNYGAKQTRNEHSIIKNEAFNAGYDLNTAMEEDADADVISALQEEVKSKTAQQKQLVARLDNWRQGAGLVALVILLLLIVDGLLIPGIVRRARLKPPPKRAPPPALPSRADDGCAGGMFERAVGRVNRMTGEFAAYWTVVAVFVFYYEVIARYVFNSPTVWAHESMFLMFGMQYLLAGGFLFARAGACARGCFVYALVLAGARGGKCDNFIFLFCFCRGVADYRRMTDYNGRRFRCLFFMGFLFHRAGFAYRMAQRTGD